MNRSSALSAHYSAGDLTPRPHGKMRPRRQRAKHCSGRQQQHNAAAALLGSSLSVPTRSCSTGVSDPLRSSAPHDKPLACYLLICHRKFRKGKNRNSFDLIWLMSSVTLWFYSMITEQFKKQNKKKLHTSTPRCVRVCACNKKKHQKKKKKPRSKQ